MYYQGNFRLLTVTLLVLALWYPCWSGTAAQPGQEETNPLGGVVEEVQHQQHLDAGRGVSGKSVEMVYMPKGDLWAQVFSDSHGGSIELILPVCVILPVRLAKRKGWYGDILGQAKQIKSKWRLSHYRLALKEFTPSHTMLDRWTFLYTYAREESIVIANQEVTNLDQEEAKAAAEKQRSDLEWSKNKKKKRRRKDPYSFLFCHFRTTVKVKKNIAENVNEDLYPPFVFDAQGKLPVSGSPIQLWLEELLVKWIRKSFYYRSALKTRQVWLPGTGSFYFFEVHSMAGDRWREMVRSNEGDVVAVFVCEQTCLCTQQYLRAVYEAWHERVDFILVKAVESLEHTAVHYFEMSHGKNVGILRFNNSNDGKSKVKGVSLLAEYSLDDIETHKDLVGLVGQHLFTPASKLIGQGNMAIVGVYHSNGMQNINADVFFQLVELEKSTKIPAAVFDIQQKDPSCADSGLRAPGVAIFSSSPGSTCKLGENLFLRGFRFAHFPSIADLSDIMGKRMTIHDFSNRACLLGAKCYGNFSAYKRTYIFTKPVQCAPKQLSLWGELSVLTAQNWKDIITHQHELEIDDISEEEEEGDGNYRSSRVHDKVVYNNVVVFMKREGCAACKAIKSVLEEMNRVVKKVFVVFCDEPGGIPLCRTHQVKGYPHTIMSRQIIFYHTKEKSCANAILEEGGGYFHIPYSGVYSMVALMSWWQKYGAGSLQSFGHFDGNVLSADVRAKFGESNLVAYVYEKKNPEEHPLLTLECFNVICEVVKSSGIDCHAATQQINTRTGYESEIKLNSDKLNNHTFIHTHIVKNIFFSRRDGLHLSIYENGRASANLIVDTFQRSAWHAEENEKTTLMNGLESDKMYRGHLLQAFSSKKDDHLTPSFDCTANITKCAKHLYTIAVNMTRPAVVKVNDRTLPKIEGLPLLLAIVHPQNVTKTLRTTSFGDSGISGLLMRLGYIGYDLFVTAYIDSIEYSAWASKFRPKYVRNYSEWLKPSELPKLIFTLPEYPGRVSVFPNTNTSYKTAPRDGEQKPNMFVKDVIAYITKVVTDPLLYLAPLH
eukprot:Nk52_evm3s318 gene=Nk52_evmTU3s318